MLNASDIQIFIFRIVHLKMLENYYEKTIFEQKP